MWVVGLEEEVTTALVAQAVAVVDFPERFLADSAERSSNSNCIGPTDCSPNVNRDAICQLHATSTHRPQGRTTAERYTERCLLDSAIPMTNSAPEEGDR